MKQLLHLFLLCLLITTNSTAQSDCQEQLGRAGRLYEEGQLEEVALVLGPCMQNADLSRPVRREMLALLQEVYLFLDEKELADSVHLELLRLDPFFRQNEAIPEVRYLQNNFETYPVATYGLRLGIYPFSRPLIDQEYVAFDDLTIGSVTYKRRNDDQYGWTANADLSFNLFGSSIELATGIGLSNIYLRRNFTFLNAHTPSGENVAADLSFLERQRWTQIPLLLQVNGLPRSKIIQSRFIPYFLLGGTSEFLVKRSAQAIGPEIDFPGDENDRSASIIQLGDQRRRFNFALMAGLGGKFRFKQTYVLLDVRYHRLLQNVVDGTDRYLNDRLLNVFNYVDNDYRLYSLNINVGAGLFLFHSKKR
ncbi:MAG: hypothetical protein R2824_29845 [Saprospiraceae bacterium]|nr:hypothetical protein [Lewinella sp.]